MNQKNFGKIVKSLRQEQMNYQSGRFWTQKDLANATHLSENIISKIERGQRVNLTWQELNQLADALKLSTLEQREFFSAATEANAQTTQQKQTIDEKAQSSFDEIWSKFSTIQLPGYVTDSLSSVVGINEPMMRFHGIQTEILEKACQTEIGCNMLGIFFRSNSPLRKAMSHRWFEPARSNISQFQFTALRYRYANRFEKMLALLHEYPDFAQLWQQSRAYPLDTTSMLRNFDYTHVKYGVVHYAATVTPTLTPYGPLYVTIFVPASSQTQLVFNELAQNTIGVKRVMPWPDQELVM